MNAIHVCTISLPASDIRHLANRHSATLSLIPSVFAFRPGPQAPYRSTMAVFLQLQPHTPESGENLHHH